MARYRIATIPGDGIGPEVMEAAVKVLRALEDRGGIGFDFVRLEAGDGLKARTGVALPPETLDEVRRSDAVLFAAVGETAKEVILPLRQRLDLYANVRPAKAYPNVPCLKDDMDIVIVRENTEGLYKMVGDRGPDWGVNVRVITRRASERISRFAFDLAEREGRGKVTSVHKNNVLDKTCGVFLEACRSVAASHPQIEYEEMIVDACAMKLILTPEKFEVLVTTNMFGDILSDEAAGLVGGLGMVPSANIGEENAIFEPVHGTAPDIAGRGIANPMAMMLSASMMLEWLGEDDEAKTVERAVMRVLKDGRVRTPDLGGSAKTEEITSAIIQELKI
ncbi:MAG: isocitrate/isopropylmalate dehydrogenase family protein [Candidatus Bathyarchaeota archaeon]|nr:isocitrate/isopropylmalate dehydrogenase family protein [Candidatus Bathyarchaeota archaeon]